MTVSDKLITSIGLAIYMRLAMLAMPLVFTGGTYMLWELYTSFQESDAAQDAQLANIERELQAHQMILDTTAKARAEFQDRTSRQFENMDTKMDKLIEKLGLVSDAVIRVQTVVETRLPPKATNAEGQLKWSQQ